MFRSRDARAHGLGLLVLALFLLLEPACSKREDPEETLPYITLDAAFQPLRSDFENDAGKVRLVAIVAPSCGHCLDTTDDISTQVMNRVTSEDLRVYFVWTSTNPTDVEPIAAKAAAEYPQERITHYWDSTGRVARAFGRQLGAPGDAPVWDVFYLYGRSATWDPDGTMPGEPATFDANAAGWTPSEPRLRVGRPKDVEIPKFNWNTMVQLSRELLAEPETGTRPTSR